jgi:competence protein ComEA
MPQLSDKKQTITIIIIVLIIAAILGYLYVSSAENNISINASDNSSDSDESVKTAETEEIIIYRVHVAGYVNNSGVYDVPSDYRVIDAIELAGGATDEAYLDAINLAAKIKDAERIYVPSKSEKNSYTAAITESTLVNINTSSLSELKTLPGIGDSRAADIINYREKNGGFESINDIKNVPGIGDGIFTRIEDLIDV